MSSQSIVEELEPRRPGGEEAEEEGLEELLEQHLEALVVIRTGGLRHDRLPVEPNPEGRNGRTTRKPFGSETTRHATKTIGSWQLGFAPWFRHQGHRRRHDGDCEPNVKSGCNRFRVRVLTVGQGDVSALTPSACQKSPKDVKPGRS